MLLWGEDGSTEGAADVEMALELCGNAAVRITVGAGWHSAYPVCEDTKDRRAVMKTTRVVWRMLLVLCLVFALAPVGAAAGQSEPPEDGPQAAEEVWGEEPARFQFTMPPEGVTVLPLADPLDAAAVPYPDPGAYFKIGSTSFQFTTADCDPDAAGSQACDNPIQAAINYLSSHNAAPAGGNIFIGAGDYLLSAATTPAANITLDADQWETPPAVVNLVGMGSSLRGDAITRVHADITLDGMRSWKMQDFIADQAASNQIAAAGCTGSAVIERVQVWGGRTLKVENHTGPVTFNEVSVKNGTMGGALIDTDGKVVVSQSSFYETAGTGLRVVAGDSVLLNMVYASGNTSSGADVHMSNPAGSFNAVSSAFNRNDLSGLIVTSEGSAFLDRVSVRLNGGAAALGVNNPPGTPSKPLTVQRSTISSNTGVGVMLSTTDGVILDGVVVENNDGDFGVLILADDSPKPIVVRDRLGPMMVQRNAQNGLHLQGVGAVSLSGLIANNNGEDGLYIYAAESKQNVTAARCKTMGNGSSGASFLINGGLVVTDSQFDDNGFTGANIQQFSTESARPVTILRTTFNDNQSNHGLNMSVRSRPTLKSIQASGNAASGLYLYLRGSLEGTAPLFVDSLTANSNGEHGLLLSTSSNVALSKVAANHNGEHGLMINAVGTTATPSVTIKGRRGQNQFSDNMFGVELQAAGRVVLSGMNMTGNSQTGLRVENIHDDLGVSLTEINASGNGAASTAQGISVTAGAAITGRRLTASGNSLSGISLNNSDSHRIDRPVVLQEVFTSDNDTDGLSILTDSPVTLASVQSLHNLDNGLNIRSTSAVTSPITINTKGSGNRFVGNGNRGIYLQAGPAVLNSILVADNGWDQLNFGLSYTMQNQPLTVNCGVFVGNMNAAIFTASLAGVPVTLNQVTFQNNYPGGPNNDYVSSGDVHLKLGTCKGW